MNKIKRPKKLIKWMFIKQVKSKDNFVDWNGKPLNNYYIEIPEWLGRAYTKGNIPRVKVIFYDKVPNGKECSKQENKSIFNKYFKENWLKKVTKARRLNNNYIKFE